MGCNVENERKSFDVQTIVQLYAPKVVGVTLVPIETIDKAEWLLFWASVFLSIFAAFLGALMSLIAIDYENIGVIIVLAICTFLLLVLCSVFAQRGFSERGKARSAAIGSTKGNLDSANISQEMSKWLGHTIFMGEKMLPLAEFKSRLTYATPPNIDINAVVQRLYTESLLFIENASSDKPIVVFNTDFRTKTSRS